MTATDKAKELAMAISFGVPPGWVIEDLEEDIEDALTAHAAEATAPLEARIRELEGLLRKCRDLVDLIPPTTGLLHRVNAALGEYSADPRPYGNDQEEGDY